jgi:hypothetical protein
MKKIKLLLCFSLFTLSSSLSFGQSWDWGGEGYGSLKANDFGSPVAADKQGDAFLTGQYEGSITFGSVTLTTSSSDILYLVKYNPAGVAQWGVQPAYTNSVSYGLSDATDTAGNIFVTGYFYGKLAFGTDTLKGSAGNCLLVKFDKNGNVLWAREINSLNVRSASMGYGVTTDISGDAYITGVFGDSIIIGSDTLKSPVGKDKVFIAKYDPSGSFLWARQATGMGTGYGRSIVSYGSPQEGFEYITGYFNDTLVFGRDTVIGSGTSSNENAFVIQYDPFGNVLWARNSKSIGTGEAAGYSVTTDTIGDAYITGVLVDTISFGSGNLVGLRTQNCFLTKYNSQGEELWSKLSGNGSWTGYSLACDVYKHVYMGGAGVGDTISWGAFRTTIPSSTTGNDAGFIMEFDTAGNVICGSILKNGGGINGDGGYSAGVASDSTGRFTYLVGTFDADTIFCGIDTLIPRNGTEATYITRWKACDIPTGIADISKNKTALTLYPNPNNGEFTIKCSVVSGKSSVEIYNMLGEKVYSQFTTHSLPLTIDLSQPSGIYLYRVLSEDGSLIGEGKVVIEK